LTYVGRGIAYANKGQYDQAISDYNKALEINPKDAVAYRERGDAYFYKGEYDSAISNFSKAIDIDPKDVVAYTYRGDAYEKKARYEEAIFNYNRAVEIDSKYVLAYNNLAWILSTAKEPRIRNGKKARELAVKACELTNWKNSACLDTLAAAYAREGDFENAAKWEEKAMESAEPAERAGRRERLECYKQRRPCPPD
jgi:tetratricopeptide (TPR) repeat protein